MELAAQQAELAQEELDEDIDGADADEDVVTAEDLLD